MAEKTMGQVYGKIVKPAKKVPKPVVAKAKRKAPFLKRFSDNIM